MIKTGYIRVEITKSIKNVMNMNDTQNVVSEYCIKLFASVNMYVLMCMMIQVHDSSDHLISFKPAIQLCN